MSTDYNSLDRPFIDNTLTLVNKIFDHVADELKDSGDRDVLNRLRKHFVPGKMLRTRLGMALTIMGQNDQKEIVASCAATELIHSATLFHDDVIDGASVRRRNPTLWREIGPTGAILMGDLFFSCALQLITNFGKINRVASFVDKVREVCATEMIHELVFRDREIDIDTCLTIARGKTGPLFAYVAETTGGNDENKVKILREVGYKLGTAYQLADDLIDVMGDEERIGKTLGTDRKRRKFTLAQSKHPTLSDTFIREKVVSMCNSALAQTAQWPELTSRLEKYICHDLFPFWDLNLNEINETSLYEVR